MAIPKVEKALKEALGEDKPVKKAPPTSTKDAKTGIDFVKPRDKSKDKEGLAKALKKRGY